MLETLTGWRNPGTWRGREARVEIGGGARERGRGGA